MKKLHSVILALAFLGVFLSGYVVSQHLAPQKETHAGRRILHYVDPMNPSHTSDKPGLAPCGMQMEPVYADQDGPGQTPGAGASAMPAGTVKISPEKQQLIGVRAEQARVSGGVRVIRTLGRVAADENRVARLTAGRDGYMGEVKDVLPTGSLVKKDQLLASYYNIDSLAAQQSYIFALNAMGQSERELSLTEQYSGIGSTGGGPASLSTKLLNAEENLKIYGMGEAQIREIARTRKLSNYIELRAPFAGLILSRNVFPFSRFQKDAEFYRIVDLSQVWVLADVLENDEPAIKPGTAARIILPGRQKVFHATVSDSLPQFDTTSRTYKVRLDVPNPGLLLRPEAFVDVEFSVPLEQTLTVPMEAVLDSGLKKTVFVDLGNGFFEPRSVETGSSFGNRIQILGGLMPGESVVTSGRFLIDSESRMKLAASGECGPSSRDPVCRMEVSRKQAEASELKSEFGGTTYYFCSPECKKEFDKDPARFSKQEGKDPEKEAAAPANERPEALPGPMKDDRSQHSETLEPPKETSKDPVCGEEVDIRAAQSSGNTYEVDGVTYYFSAPACKQVFQMHPERFLAKPKATAPQMPGMPAEDHPPHGVDAAEGMK